MNQGASASSPASLLDLPRLRLYVNRRAIPYVVIGALAVALTILAINFASIVAERNDYLQLIQVYGLGCRP